MKKLLLASAVTIAAVSAWAGGSFADVSEQMKNSKYCRENNFDVLCMGPESLATRKSYMEMTKEKAVENRTKYCREDAAADDPICDEKMKNDTTGYN